MQKYFPEQVIDGRKKDWEKGLWQLPVNPGASPSGAHIKHVGGTS